jgi:hypothetical protein
LSEEAGQAPVEQPTPHEAALSIVESWTAKPEAAPEKPKESEKLQAPAEQKDEASQPEESTQEAKPEVRRLKLKYKGEDREVDESEAINLAQMGYDYTQKSQALAKEKEDLHESIRKQVEPKLSEYQKQLQLMERVLMQVSAPELQNVDWNKLATENPAEWARLAQRKADFEQARNIVIGEQQRLTAEQRTLQQKSIQKYLEKAETVLQSEIPNWGPQLKTEIANFGVKVGFSKEELSQIADPRAIKLLHAAMQYERAKDAKPLVDKKVADAPKVIKPGVSEKSDPKGDKWKDAAGRIKKSMGKDQDALLDAARLLI